MRCIKKEKRNCPLFSIVIPIYNEKDNLEKTLETVYSQSLQDYEIILVDDGSTDGSIESIKHILDERCVIVTKENQGLPAARNSGLQRARGIYMALLDADDFWYPDHLEVAARFFSNNPQMLWYCPKWDRASDIVNDSRPDEHSDANFIICNYFESGHSIDKNRLHPSAVVLHSKLIPNNGKLFPEQMINGCEDAYTWYKIASNNPLYGWYGRSTMVYNNSGELKGKWSEGVTELVPLLLHDFPEQAVPTNPCLRKTIDVWMLQRVQRSEPRKIVEMLREYPHAMSNSYRASWCFIAVSLKIFGSKFTLWMIEKVKNSGLNKKL